MKKVGVIVAGILLSLSLVFAENLAITATPSQGKAPLTVDLSISNLPPESSVSWDFDNDGVTDSTQVTPTFTYAQEGEYTVSAIITPADATPETVTTTIAVSSPLTVSITANPPSGIAPLSVQFTAAASGKEPLHYAWDFNNDGVVDNTNQNPSTILETAGDMLVTLTVTDAGNNKVMKTIPVTVQAYDSKIKVLSFFPTALNRQENQVTFLIANEGSETIKDLTAKVIGQGIQHLSSTTISKIKPGEQDSLTVKMNVLNSGELSAIVKIDEKSFPITFTVAAQQEYSKVELEQQLQQLRQRVQRQEDVYYDKKAQNYLVSELFDGLKSAKQQLQNAQEQLFTNNLAGAAIAMNLASSEIDDVSRDLEEAQKQKQTFLVWLKENALALTTIIAALGTISGFLVKASLRAKKIGEDVRDKALKFGGNVKGKITPKSREEPSSEPVAEIKEVGPNKI